jgi:hypothetical protein
LQDRTYTPPVIDPSGKSRVDSPADVTDSPDQKRPSVSSDNEKLTEQDLNKDVPDVVAVQEAEFESY